MTETLLHIDASASTLAVRTRATGMLARLAHDLELRSNELGQIDPDKFAAYRHRGESLSPIGRMGEALDQAHLVHYLASDASKFATGAIFRANGGVGIVW